VIISKQIYFSIAKNKNITGISRDISTLKDSELFIVHHDFGTKFGIAHVILRFLDKNRVNFSGFKQKIRHVKLQGAILTIGIDF